MMSSLIKVSSQDSSSPKTVDTLESTAKANNSTKTTSSEVRSSVSDHKPKLLITGGSGYLGYNIALGLAVQGFDSIIFDIVQPLDRLVNAFKSRFVSKEIIGEIKYVAGDIRSFDAINDCVRDYGVDIIIHTASYGMSGTENLPAFDDKVEAINLGGSRNVLKAALKNKVIGLVYTSTINVVFNGDSPVFGGREDNLPYLKLKDHYDHYSRCKQVAEELILAASGKRFSCGRRFYSCALRLNGLYGPYEQRHLPRTIDMIRGKKAIAGYGYHSKQDLVHLDNAVQAHVKASVALMDVSQCEILDGQAYFITDNNPVNTLKFFMQPIMPCVLGPQAKPPEFQVPLYLVLLISWVSILLSKLFGSRFRLPSWGLTPTEVFKTGITHYFRIDKARLHFGYEPEVRWDESSWREILSSFGLYKPKKQQ